MHLYDSALMHFYPFQDLSADETMVGFRGSTQYTPNKPIKWGIKAFTLADAKTGYMLNILVYTGTQTLDHADPQFAHLPVLCRSVLHLVSPYFRKGHHVFADRFYSSIPLVQTLVDQQTHFTGTIVKNRVGLPDPIPSPFYLGDDESIQFQSGNLMVIAWRARSKKVPVILISSSCSAGLTDVTNCRGDQVKKPLAVDRYNRSMNGVDHKDQHCVYYSFVRKTLKWWTKLFFYLLECVMLMSLHHHV